MSMPSIARNANPVSMRQAVTDLLESIALEETAMSHILNAEGEKLQRAIAMEDIDFCQLMEVNDSVANMVNVVGGLENILKDKLEFVANNLYYPCCDSCDPCDPCDPCCNPCDCCEPCKR